MSDSYTKLFKGIVASTIVGEPVATRWAWVTLLAEANREGCVYASIPGLARIANITLAETEAALACFLSPDPYSRTKDHEGRRIEVIDGGWRLLNHAKYRAMRDEAERAEYKRQWDRENRPKRKRKPDKQPDNGDDPDRADPTSTSTITSSNTPLSGGAGGAGSKPTAAGLACKAMREAGIQRVNPSHPDLLELIAAGVTTQEFGDTAREMPGKGFPYILTAIRNRRAEPRAPIGNGQVQPPPRQPDYLPPYRERAAPSPAGFQAIGDLAAKLFPKAKEDPDATPE